MQKKEKPQTAVNPELLRLHVQGIKRHEDFGVFYPQVNIDRKVFVKTEAEKAQLQSEKLAYREMKRKHKAVFVEKQNELITAFSRSIIPNWGNIKFDFTSI